MKIERVWAMPNHLTFSIKPIKELIDRYWKESKLSIDPFANDCRLAVITNDLNPDSKADYNMEALDFLKLMQSKEVKPDLVFFDPPYSLRQCSEMYKSVGKPVTQRDTQIFGRWTEYKEIISQIITPGGICISCGWNSQGMGLKNGFEIVEILMVCHGGAHNDTICTVERKKGLAK